MPRSMWFRGDAPYELDTPNPDNTDLVTHSTSKTFTTRTPYISVPTPYLRHVGHARNDFYTDNYPILHMPFYQKPERQTRSYAL